MNKRSKAPQQPKLKANRKLTPKVEPKISVSLQYLTKGKDHNFDYFSAKDFRTKAQAFEQLLEFLRRLTAKTLLAISSLPKDVDCGFEQLPFQQMKFKPDGIKLGQDAKIHVFRFGNGGNYRLLGFFEYDVLQIIGFDFN